LRRGLDPKLGCGGHAGRCAIQVQVKVGVRVWLLTYDELSGAFRTRTREFGAWPVRWLQRRKIVGRLPR
jgi:hypothetical protein